MEPSLCLKTDLPTIITVTQHSAGFIDHNVESMSWKCTLMHVNNLRPYFLYCFFTTPKWRHTACVHKTRAGKGSISFLPSATFFGTQLQPSETASNWKCYWGGSDVQYVCNEKCDTWKETLNCVQLNSEIYWVQSTNYTEDIKCI